MFKKITTWYNRNAAVRLVRSSALVILCVVLLGAVRNEAAWKFYGALLSFSVFFFFLVIENIKFQQEKLVTSSVLEMQEQTFQYISHVLHDTVSLKLTLAKLNLHTLDINDQQKISVKAEESAELIGKALLELRELGRGLSGDLIIAYGLEHAIDHELEHIRKVGNLHIVFTESGERKPIKQATEFLIFRVIQEAFNNMLKHAKATEATLSLHYNPNSIFITIKDNGIGFDNNASNPAGNGLASMKSRVKAMNGELDIQSSVGMGTEIRITVPM